MPFEFDLSKSPEDNIRQIISERIQYILDQLRKSDQHDESVHEARKAFKQIRAVLRLVRPALPKEVYQAENIWFRDTARRLAPLRDGFVVIETLDLVRQKITGDDLLTLIDSLHTELEKDYEKQRHEFLHGDTIGAVIQDLETWLENQKPWKFQKSGFDLISSGLKATYQSGRRRMRKAIRTSNPVDYHEWRKSTKYLWYQIRLLTPLERLVMESYAEQLKSLSEELGDAHDFLVLSEKIGAYPEIHSAAGALLQEKLGMIRSDYERNAFPIGEIVFAEKSKQFSTRMAAYWNAIQQ